MPEADICLLLEGTFPYVTGGVSSWLYELIKAHNQFTFHIVCLLPKGYQGTYRYEIPKNVLSINNVYLQDLPVGDTNLPKKEKIKLFQALEVPLLKLQNEPTIEEFKFIINALKSVPCKLGSSILFDSEESWHMLVRMYLSTIGNSSFLNFFWSYRGLLGGLYSVILCDLPTAKIYHTICTGFAGLMLARAYAETGKPCLTTEHGIYTNERRIEIALANWLDDLKSMNLSVEVTYAERDIKDYWIDMFCGYSKLCYQASEKIITLFEGNKHMEISDGADPKKIEIIPNGIDYDVYSQIPREDPHPPTVALIGRVVPIKDIKTFIRAISYLNKKISDLKALIIGPEDEDPDYYQQCVELIDTNNLSSIITFTGKVDIKSYLGSIDVVALTSLSEGQPLVLLEVGAAGIPSVATNVGACHEIIYGNKEEHSLEKKEAPGGIVVPLANPQAVSDALYTLLSNSKFYEECSNNIKKRVKTYYNKSAQTSAYNRIYDELIQQGSILK